MPSYDEAEIVKHISEGHPYLDTLPEWDPVGCSHLFPVAEPVMHFKMDDNEDNPTVHDVRGIYPQTFVDAGGDPNTDAHTAAGHIGTSLAFDGTNDHIILNYDDWTPYFDADQNFTFAYWFYRPTGASMSARYDIGNVGVNGAGILHYTGGGGGKARMQAVTVGGSASLSITTMGWTLNAWRHAAFVKGSNFAKIYLGGVEKGTNSDADWCGKCRIDGTNFCIAKHVSSGTYTKIRYDDIRLYNYALSAAEVAALAAM
jgi:hypothetical protein